ncbi:LLM class flavin-dependent oxidoreductase [Effusibacillus dendaii]|uniref:Monooxygenase n=1 Tax=Effusibacillus dendaii TaxID=2743772 RepID=A0A7I8DDM7_9BACL|nr:LLM class flavin-dependent oxidoreductase [Effusibacillus dendaii]BCJ88298.1 monooxygenase [Effusibacillus dendaii]
MKFVSFNLMPYRELPADFEGKYPSVWVTPPKTLFDPVKGHRMYHDYLDELEFSIDLGYDAVGVNEHHSNAYGMMPSPNLMASILSRKVRRSDKTSLMVLGNSLAAYNPPIRVAEEFAMLDVLSGGKFIAGFPVGTSMDGNYAYGINPAELRERYYEAHDLIMKTWNSDDLIMWNGKYNQFRYINPWPRTAQRPHPPVWIPGGGSVETYDFSIKHNYSFSYLSYFGHKYAKKVMGPFWQRNDELGADRNPYKAGYAQIICVSETDERAQTDYEEHVRYFFNKCLHIDPRIAEAPGYRTVKSLRAGLRSQFDGTQKSAAQMLKDGMGWKELIEEGFIVAGSPASVRDQLAEGAKDLRVGNIMCLLHIGSMPHWLAIKNLQLFAEEVMPHLREIYSEWDHSHYWPTGFAEEEQSGSVAQV